MQQQVDIELGNKTITISTVLDTWSVSIENSFERMFDNVIEPCSKKRRIFVIIIIVDKRGKVTSPVWQYFGYFQSDKSQTDVVCKLVKVVVPTKSGSTTNLFYHLSRSHLLEYSSVKQPQTSTSASTGGTPHKLQQTTMERYSAAVPYDKTSKR